MLLTAIGLFFLLSPLGSYVIQSYVRGVSIFGPARVLRGTHDTPFGLTVLLAPLLVGTGLLLVKRWGWWLFMAYTPLLLFFNAQVLLASGGAFPVAALVQNVLLFASIGYFLRKDIYAPFFAAGPRGWRRGTRVPMVVDVVAGGETHKTRDFSEGGCFVVWPHCPHKLGEAVEIKFEIDGKKYELAAGVARIETEGVALAFRGLTRETREAIGGGTRKA